jgi:syntaxin 16
LEKRGSSISSNEDLLGLEENPLAPNSSEKLWEQQQIQRDTDNMDQDVNTLADSVTVLHKMFKQMHEMIFEQGTIVDRIDYNIEQGQRHVKDGTKKLVKAKEHQDNTCATRVIKCEMFTALFLFLILVLKFVGK